MTVNVTGRGSAPPVNVRNASSSARRENASAGTYQVRIPRIRSRRKSRPASIITTSSRCLIIAMNGRNASWPGWPLNKSSGAMLEVATTTTPRANSAWNSRPRIMASAMSLTWNSSKQSSAASRGNGIGQRWDRIGAVRIGLLPGEHPGVRGLHEAMEMDALLARYLGAGEEQVHQHRFAAADLANQIEAFRRALGREGQLRLAAQHAVEQAVAPNSALTGADRSRATPPTGSATVGRVVLRWVGREFATSDHGGRGQDRQRTGNGSDVGIHGGGSDSASRPPPPDGGDRPDGPRRGIPRRRARNFTSRTLTWFEL